VQTHLAMVDARTIELIGCMNQTHLIYKKDDDGFYRRKTFSSKVGPVQNLDDFITYRNGIYFRQTGMDAIEKFDSQGRLLFMDDAKGATVTVEYDFKGRISQIKRSDGSRLQFTYSVATALGPEFLTKLTTINPHAPPPMRTKILNYRYRQDDLVSVADERKVETRFTYDTFHNLIDVHYPDQTSEHISYDTEKDQVTAIKERDGCLNQLTVEPALQRPLQTYRTRLRKTCAGRVVANTAFEFALSQSQSGTRLVKLRIHSAKSAAEINFETKSSAYSQIASQPVTLKKEK
jgi:YD repeat-containing protein